MRLRAAAALIPHVAEVGTAVTDSLKQTGGVEGILTFVWLATATTARFDSVSHIVPSYQLTVDTCNTYATEPVPACSAHWAGSPADVAKAAAKRARTRRKHAKRRARAKQHDEQATPPPSSEAPQQPTTPAHGPLPSLPQLPQVPLPDLPGLKQPPKQDTSDKLLDFLLGK
jgi:hypothetical protein